MALILGGGELAKWFTTPNSTTITVGAVAFTLSQQVSTDISKDDSGIPTITHIHAHHDSVYTTFLENSQNLSASADTETLTYEAGTKVDANATSTTYLEIVKGGLVSGGTDNGKRMFWAGLVTIGNSSGSWTQEADTYNKPTLISNGIAALGTITIPSTLLTDFMVTPATCTIPSTLKYGKVFFG